VIVEDGTGLDHAVSKRQGLFKATTIHPDLATKSAYVGSKLVGRYKGTADFKTERRLKDDPSAEKKGQVRKD